MKTKKHGSGLTHKQVVRFSNRLAAQQVKNARQDFGFSDGFYRGWSSCAQYFAHQLRDYLRVCERVCE